MAGHYHFEKWILCPFQKLDLSDQLKSGLAGYYTDLLEKLNPDFHLKTQLKSPDLPSDFRNQDSLLV